MEEYIPQEYSEKDRTSLWKKMKQLCVKTLLAVHPNLCNEYNSRLSKEGKAGKHSVRSRCFCIMGVDILVDVKLKPWLLEINHLPSFTTDSDLDFDIKKRLVEQTLDLLPMVPVKL